MLQTPPNVVARPVYDHGQLHTTPSWTGVSRHSGPAELSQTGKVGSHDNSLCGPRWPGVLGWGLPE